MVPRELKGFARVDLEPGETATVIFTIEDSELCYFNAEADDFVLESCTYSFEAGFSSRTLPCSVSWKLRDEAWSAL